MENNLKVVYLNEYQEAAVATAVYPNKGEIGGLIYTVLGMVGEAGELANKLKKHIRNGTPVNKDVLRDELGDVLWYVSAVSAELDARLEDVANENIDKLLQRKAEGTLKDRKETA